MPGEKNLHPYQKFCVDFLEEKPQCALFLDCGLGKTIITLTAISHLLYDSYEVSRVLIIAPLRVARDTWIGELSKWEHLKGLRMESTETAFQDDRPAGYRTYIYLNLWSDIDPTDMANRIRQAMYDADFWMLEESDKGYNQPAYDPATRTYTVQWTWVYWQEAPLGGNDHADGTAGL